MNKFLISLIYLAVIGLASFFIAWLFPKRWFSYNKFPYRSTNPEKEDRLYASLGVKEWKEKLPDMSKIFTKIMPTKRLPEKITASNIELMVQETCIAELVHRVLVVLGFGCVFIFDTAAGWIVSELYALGNLPFIIIQRFNRPKLVRMLNRLRGKEVELRA